MGLRPLVLGLRPQGLSSIPCSLSMFHNHLQFCLLTPAHGHTQTPTQPHRLEENLPLVSKTAIYFRRDRATLTALKWLKLLLTNSFQICLSLSVALVLLKTQSSRQRKQLRWEISAEHSGGPESYLHHHIHLACSKPIIPPLRMEEYEDQKFKDEE